jgi:hypothetical protein
MDIERSGHGTPFPYEDPHLVFRKGEEAELHKYPLALLGRGLG